MADDATSVSHGWFALIRLVAAQATGLRRPHEAASFRPAFATSQKRP
jgi:hypothetical protein